MSNCKQCDICYSYYSIEDKEGVRPILHNYTEAALYFMTLYSKPFPDSFNEKIDLCPQCANDICDWIKNRRKECLKE